jgi:hypothetical protein
MGISWMLFHILVLHMDFFFTNPILILNPLVRLFGVSLYGRHELDEILIHFTCFLAHGFDFVCLFRNNTSSLFFFSASRYQ